MIPLAVSSAWLLVNPLLRSTAVDEELGPQGRGRGADLDGRNRSELPDSSAPQHRLSSALPGDRPGAARLRGPTKLKATPTPLGTLIVQEGKLWYVDRMVLLFEEIKTEDREYARWEW